MRQDVVPDEQIAPNPFLDELRRTGALRLAASATASCPHTACGVASLLSSRLLGALAPGNLTLPKLLYDQGYRIHFLLSGDHDWHGLEQLYGHEHHTYFDGPMARRHGATDDRVLFEALDRIADADGRPAFFYFHVMAPHVLAVREAASRRFLPADATAWWPGRRFDARSAINFYDNGVVQADRIVRGLFERLGRKGYLKDALVVLTADHGESLGERQTSIFGHYPELYREYLSIPLLVYEPGRDPWGELGFARQIDIAPTIVARLGLPIPDSWQGLSLLEPGGARYALATVRPSDGTAMLIDRRPGAVYKYLRYSGARLDAREELYELSSDPYEAIDLFDGADRELTGELRGVLDRMISDPGFLTGALRRRAEPGAADPAPLVASPPDQPSAAPGLRRR